MKSKEQAVSENFEAFEKQLPKLLQTHAGKYALLRDKKVVEFFDSVGDAVKYGRDNFPDSLYSVQLVTQEGELEQGPTGDGVVEGSCSRIQPGGLADRCLNGPSQAILGAAERGVELVPVRFAEALVLE